MSRCSAITKSGSQCSRQAKSGKYCAQHVLTAQNIIVAQPIAELGDLPDLTQECQKIMEQVHPDTTLSPDASAIVRACLVHVYSTMKANPDQTHQWGLTKVLDPETELYKHAVSEMNKAIYKSTHGIITGGLIFSIQGRDANHGFAISSCLEYLTAEILELSGNIARERDYIVEDFHIYVAIERDEELNNVFKTVINKLDSNAMVHKFVTESVKNQILRDSFNYPLKEHNNEFDAGNCFLTMHKEKIAHMVTNLAQRQGTTIHIQYEVNLNDDWGYYKQLWAQVLATQPE
jgi:hypothetical protein